MTQPEELATLTDDEIASVNGGIMDILNTVMSLAGNLVNKYGDDKAKQGFSTASGIVGKLGPQIASLLGGAQGGGQAGGDAGGGSATA